MSSEPRHPPGRLIEANGIRWHIEEGGAGPRTLVLLHGYLGSTAVWRAAMPVLGTGLRVIAADLPGAGYSDRPEKAPYDLSWLTGEFRALLDALELERPLVGGHSLGGSVALLHAAQHPARTSGLVLVSPLAYRQPPPPGLRFARKHPRVMRVFFSSPVGRAVIPRLVGRAAYATPNARAAANAKLLLSHLDAPGGWAAATRMGLAAGDAAPDEAALRRVSAPAIVFWGVHDPVHPPAYAQRLCRDLAGPARLVVLERSSHNAHEEEAERFAQEVLDWCSSL